MLSISYILPKGNKGMHLRAQSVEVNIKCKGFLKIFIFLIFFYFSNLNQLNNIPYKQYGFLNMILKTKLSPCFFL